MRREGGALDIPPRSRRPSGRGVLNLLLVGGAFFGLALVWRKGFGAIRATPPSWKLLALLREVEGSVGPFLVSKDLTASLLGEGKVVHTWRLTVEGGVPLGRVREEVEGAVRRVGARLVSSSWACGGVAILVIPSEAERCVIILRRGPRRGGFSLGLVVVPDLGYPEGIASLAGLHVPLTFALDPSSPEGLELARWLSGQGYEVIARGVSDPARISAPFTGLLVEGRPSVEVLSGASRRGIFLVLEEGGGMEGVRAVVVRVRVGGGPEEVRSGLLQLLSLARREGSALGLVRLSGPEVAAFLEVLQKWVAEGVELRTAGEMARREGRRDGRGG